MVRIITDSGCDLTREEAEKLGVQVIPITVTFGEEEYQDGVTLTTAQFYEKLIQAKELPHTSQIPPYAYGEIFRACIEAGDTVVCLSLSSKLSGSYRNAAAAAEDFEGVYAVDTMNVCIGQQCLVRLAARLRDEGMDAARIAARLEEVRGRVRVLALLDTLEYLKKGGRISPTVAFAGEVLGIKPVVSVTDGEVALAGKARGSKNGNNLLRKLIEETGQIDFSLPCVLGYTGLNDELLRRYMEDNTDLFEGHTDIPISAIGATVGTHIGPGCVGAAYFN